MSRQVDERVVSMQFDNKHFESNVQTSMSTLDKLKAKLNLKGASKGLENIDSAAKKVNMSGLSAGVEAVGMKFSAMQVIGVTALSNLTTAAMNAGKKIVSALAIDPVKTGFQEYETQINAVQTIMSNTRKEMEGMDEAARASKVNEYLDELNKYADMTIYNFTEMTRNIGTFTAAGVNLDTSVNAIKGIANLAAVSGSTSQQASTAMYQLSQAMSSGSVKLMDWNSVVNAGMGGKVFQDALTETARVHGINIDDMISKYGSFRETLQTGWLTTDVLTETLQKFTLTTEGLTEAEIKANREMLKAKGYTDDQIDAIFELGKEATSAATKVKTFTQLWDVLKEAAQSGWAQTWKIIVGDFVTAKNFFTPLSDFLTGFINKMSDARNNFIKAVLYPWETIKKKLDASAFGKIQKTIEGASEALAYYQEMMHSIWMGNWKNSDTGRYSLLDAAGHDHRVLQELVNLSDTHFHEQGWKYQLTIEDVNGVLQKYGYQTLTVAENVEDMSVSLSKLTDEQLRNLGLTDEEITLFRMLAAEADRTGVSVWDLIEKMSKVDGRTLLLNGLKNIGDMLVGTFKALGTAWSEIFPAPSIVRTYTLIEAFAKFTEKLRLTDKKTGELNENGKKLVRTFKGIFALVDLVATILGGGLRITFKIISAVLGAFNLNILDLTAYIGDALVKFRDWLKGLFNIEGAIKKAVPYIVEFGKSVVDAFKKAGKYIGPVVEWFKAFATSKILPFLQRLGSAFKTAFGKIAKLFAPATTAITNWFESLKKSDNLGYDIVTGIAKGIAAGAKLFAKALSILATEGLSGLQKVFGKKDGKNAAGNILSGLANGLKDGAKIVWDAITGLAKSLIDKFKELLGIHSPSLVFWALGGFIVSGLLLGIKALFPEVWTTIKDLGQKCIDAIGEIDIGAVVAVISLLGSILAINKVADALNNFTEPMEEFGNALKRVSKGATNYLNAKAFGEIAKAIAILVACVVVLTLVDQKKMWSAIGVIGAIAGILAVLMGVVVLVSKFKADPKAALDMGKTMLAIVALAGAIAIMAIAMRILGSLSLEELLAANTALLYIAGIIVGLIAATKLGGPAIYTAGGTILMLSVAMWLLAGLIKVVAKIDNATLERGMNTIATLGAFFVGLMAAMNLLRASDDAIKNVGPTILKISLAMILLAIVVKICGAMDPAELKQGVIALAVFGALVVAIMWATKFVGGDAAAIGKLGTTIVMISLAMSLLVVLAILCSWMDPEGLAKGAAAVAAFGVIIAGLIAATKLLGTNAAQTAAIGKTILRIAGAIAAMAIVAVLLGLVKTEILVRGGLAMLALVSMISILIAVCKNAKDVDYMYLFGLTAAIAVLGGVVIALSCLDPKKVAVATVCMSALMLMFALFAKITDSIKTTSDWKSKLIAIGILTGVVLLLGGLLILLSAMKVTNTMSNVLAIAVLLAVMTGVLFVLSKCNVKLGPALKGALALTLLAVPLLAFVGVLYLMKDLNGALKNVIALSILATVLTALLIPLTVIGLLGYAPFIGVLALLAMAVPLVAFVGILYLMDGIQNAEKNALLLAQLLILMTSVLTVLAIIGPFALVGVAAMSSLTALMVAMGVLVVAIGAIFDACPKLKEFVDTGIDILVKLAEGLGKAIGAFITALAGAIMTILPQLGLSLSMFAVNAMPFIQIVSHVNSNLLKGAGILAGAIIALVVADFISAVGDALGLDLVGLGDKLNKFGTKIGPFLDVLGGISETTAKAAGNLAALIIALTVADVINGINNLLGLEGGLDTFGDKLAGFGTSMAKFLDSIKDLTDADLDRVKIASTAGKNMSDMISNLPKSGGWAQTILGEADLTKFSDGLTSFGDAMIEFSATVNKLTEEDITRIEKMVEVGKAYAELESSLPKKGGWAQTLLGSSDLTLFGFSLIAYGKSMAEFVETIKDITKDDVTKVKTLGEASQKLCEAEAYLPKQGGLWQDIAGASNIANFGINLKSYGKSLVDFVDTIKDLDANKAKTKIDGMKPLVESIVNNIADPVTKFWGSYGDVGSLGEGITALGQGIMDVVKVARDVTSSTKGQDYKEVKALEPMIDLFIKIAKKAKVDEATKKQLTNYNAFLFDFEAMVNYLSSVSTAAGKLEPDMTETFAPFESAVAKIAGILSNEHVDTMAKANTGAAIENMGEFSQAVLELIGTNFGAVEDFCQSLKILAQADVSGFNKTWANVGSVSFDAFISSFENAEGMSTTAGTELITAIADGFKTGADELNSNVDSAIETMSKYVDNCRTLGGNMALGLAQGINSWGFVAKQAARALALSIENTIRDAWQVNSPSKLFYGIALGVGEGMENAFGDSVYGVKRSADELANSAVSGFSDTVRMISDAINADIDSTPTIRPVFDLTDLKSGAATINGMLDGNRTLSVDTATIGSLSASMSKLQNGNNSAELLSAIKGLRKDVANNPRNTYSINGINVTEGSDVATAIETIVRAIKVEERT